MRFFNRISIFCYKIVNNIILKDFFVNMKMKDRNYFRDRDIFFVPNIKSTKGMLPFSYFSPTFVNKILKNSYNLPLKTFKKSLYENLYINYSKFVTNFSF